MTKNLKSQSGLEFVALTAVVIFLFTGLFLAIQESSSDKIKQNKDLMIKDLALSVQDEIRLAHESVDGYYREFNLPQDINGMGYEINITEGLVYVRTNDGKHAIAYPVSHVSGNAAKGKNTIKKENGEVKLNQQ